MNIYDIAHNLARAIKNSDEFKNYKQIKEEVTAVPELNDMLVDFQQKQFQIQAAQLSGQEIDQELMNNFQQSLQILTADPKAAQYLQAEMSFATMISDVYKILEDAMKVD